MMATGGTTANRIDYNVLAKAIIENYASSSLAGKTQSVKDAFAALNSNLGKITVSASDPIKDCNDLPIGSIAYIYGSAVNVPPVSPAVVLTFGVTKAICQLAYNHNGIAVRRYSIDAWTEWKTISTS